MVTAPKYIEQDKSLTKKTVAPTYKNDTHQDIAIITQKEASKQEGLLTLKALRSVA